MASSGTSISSGSSSVYFELRSAGLLLEELFAVSRARRRTSAVSAGFASSASRISRRADDARLVDDDDFLHARLGAAGQLGDRRVGDGAVADQRLEDEVVGGDAAAGAADARQAICFVGRVLGDCTRGMARPRARRRRSRRSLRRPETREVEQHGDQIVLRQRQEAAGDGGRRLRADRRPTRSGR